jgi:hypothetical protein
VFHSLNLLFLLKCYVEIAVQVVGCIRFWIEKGTEAVGWEECLGIDGDELSTTDSRRFKLSSTVAPFPPSPTSLPTFSPFKSKTIQREKEWKTISRNMMSR